MTNHEPQEQPPDPPVDSQTMASWWTGLRWTEGAYMQLQRLEDAYAEFDRAMDDARMRKLLNDGDPARKAWRNSYDGLPAHDPQRPVFVPSASLAMQLQTELDLLLVALRHVMRAQDCLPSEAVKPMGGQRILELLRNVAEHWDEPGGRSANLLSMEFPNSDASVTTVGKEMVVGGVDGIPASRIRGWLARVYQALQDAIAYSGEELLRPEESIIEGDDLLSWPAERMQYHWSIPQLPPEEWNHDPIPPEALDLLGLLHRNLRLRDSED